MASKTFAIGRKATHASVAEEQHEHAVRQHSLPNTSGDNHTRRSRLLVRSLVRSHQLSRHGEGQVWLWR